MMYIVYIAVCLSTTPVQECNRDTAVNWMVAPEVQQGLGSCMKHGQEYAAESHLLREGDYAKIYCRPPSQFRKVG